MIWLMAGALLAMAGLNAPLALCALSIAAYQGAIEPRAPLQWLGEPWFIGLTFALLIIQLLADLYFVPITVRDRSYLNPYRTHNNYLHARVQSLYRPLAGAVIAAALFAWGGEALRIVESPMNFRLFTIPGIPGMRMVLFSVILMVVILFARRGIMGRSELSWDRVFAALRFQTKA